MGTRRAIFINRFFHPDHSATSQLLSDLAFHLASRGWSVEVVTSRQRYDDARAQLPPHEHIDGVEVHRIVTTRFGRALLAGRALDYATFYLSAFLTLLRRARRGTIVIAMTDPPLISVVAAMAAVLRGAVLINWIQDLFPEVAEALGVMRRGTTLLKGARNWSLRRARTNVVLGDRMAARLRVELPGNAQPDRTITVQHNWAVVGLSPVARATNPLRAEWKLGRRLAVSYSGNLGRAHELKTIVGAMRQLPDIDFVIIGSGAQLQEVQNASRDLANVQFHRYQTRPSLGASLSAADVHLVSLRPDLEGLIVPSKIYGILAVGRPAVFIGDAEGEVASMIRSIGCGANVSIGDVAALAGALRKLERNREEAEEMGRRGRLAYEMQFDSTVALREWERIMSEAADA